MKFCDMAHPIVRIGMGFFCKFIPSSEWERATLAHGARKNMAGALITHDRG